MDQIGRPLAANDPSPAPLLSGLHTRRQAVGMAGLSGPSRKTHRWFVFPMGAMFLLLPCLILMSARREDMPALMFAYFNILVIGSAMIYFIRQRTFAAIIPVAFLTWTIVCFPLASIYFGLCDPDCAYGTVSGSARRIMDGNLRVQAVTLLLAIGYLATVRLLLPRRSASLPVFSPQNPATARMAYVAAALAFVAYIALMLTYAGAGRGTSLYYFFSGTYQYLTTVPMIIGALFPKIPKAVRFSVLTFFCLTSALFLVIGGRTFVLLPWVMMAFGLLFLSQWPERRKIMLVLIAFLVFPLVVVIGDTARNVGKGRASTFEEKKEAFSHWQEWLGQGSIASRTIGRLFSTGGHSIITLSPENVDYLDFDFPRYAKELVVSTLVPGHVYSDYYYSTTYHLNRYDLRVNESTSIEMTLPGSLWMLGGWLPVLLGSIWVGLIHSAMMRWVHSATLKSPYQGLFYLAIVVSMALMGINAELISHTRDVVKRVLAAILLWHLLVRPILGRSASAAWLRRSPNLHPARPYYRTQPALSHRS